MYGARDNQETDFSPKQAKDGVDLKGREKRQVTKWY
jgi:hypothetical protein